MAVLLLMIQLIILADLLSLKLELMLLVQRLIVLIGPGHIFADESDRD